MSNKEKSLASYPRINVSYSLDSKKKLMAKAEKFLLKMKKQKNQKSQKEKSFKETVPWTTEISLKLMIKRKLGRQLYKWNMWTLTKLVIKEKLELKVLGNLWFLSLLV